MNKSTLGSEWVKNPDGGEGLTWNPISGCLNGCVYCYARRLANGRLKSHYLSNLNVAPWGQYQHEHFREMGEPFNYGYGNLFYPRLWENKLDPTNKNNPYMWKSPRGIFVCNMSDLFGIGVPEAWTRKVLDHIIASPQHRFYLLTKQPQNLIKFSPFPDNAWVGVSATNHLQAKKGMKALKDIQAKIKFISFEPLLADMGFNDTRWAIANQVIKTVDWVIIGACTGTFTEMCGVGYELGMKEPRERIASLGKGKYALLPELEWVREIVEACDKAGIPVFLKNNLDNLLPNESPFRTNICTECEITDCRACDLLLLRQEIPSA